jgi:integrase/recombinase XerD
MNLEELIVHFCTYLLVKKGLAGHTIQSYKNDLEQFSSYFQTHGFTLDTVSIEAIRGFFAYIRHHGVGGRSAARKLSALKMFFSYAAQHYGIQDYAKDITIPLYEKKLPRYLSEHEIETLLRATHRKSSFKGLRNRVIVYLLYATGMRISELAHLKCTDVDCTAGTVQVQGKGSKQRLIPLSSAIIPMIKEYIHALWTRTTKDNQRSLYLFGVKYKGTYRPITRNALWYIIKNIWASTGSTKPLSPHMLRHSMATHMLGRGAHTRALQELLGHESLVTVQVYTHIEVGHMRALYDKKHPRS